MTHFVIIARPFANIVAMAMCVRKFWGTGFQTLMLRSCYVGRLGIDIVPIQMTWNIQALIHVGGHQLCCCGAVSASNVT